MSAPTVPPTLAPENGAEVLAAVEAFLSRFVIYPSEATRTAHVLWVAHTWFMDKWESTPRLAFLSPEPGSGKSRALEVSEPLVPRPIHAVNMSPAALFRMVAHDDGLPTIMYDEIDTVFGPKAKDNEDIRGLLNAGHRRGAMTYRVAMVGQVARVESFESYSAVALAGLHDLPDTIMTRSVVVRMRRRAPGERVEPWRARLQIAEGHAIRDRLEAWADQAAESVGWPDMPDGVEDRSADVWEPLLAVADLAGGGWPERGRAAAIELVKASAERPPSLNVLLLNDLRRVFTEAGTPVEMATETILERLCELPESPWADLRGKPLNGRGLSQRLGNYGVSSQKHAGGRGVRGYLAADLADPWSRYLPEPEGSGTSGTGGTGVAASVPEVPDVPAASKTAGIQTSDRCTLCGQPLLLEPQTREVCERCRIEAMNTVEDVTA